MVEAVLAGFERAVFEDAEEVEGIAAADDVGALELDGYGARSGAGCDIDVGSGIVVSAGGRADGSVDEIAGNGGGDERQEEQGCEELDGAFLSRSRLGRAGGWLEC